MKTARAEAEAMIADPDAAAAAATAANDATFAAENRLLSVDGEVLMERWKKGAVGRKQDALDYVKKRREHRMRRRTLSLSRLSRDEARFGRTLAALDRWSCLAASGLARGPTAVEPRASPSVRPLKKRAPQVHRQARGADVVPGAAGQAPEGEAGHDGRGGQGGRDDDHDRRVFEDPEARARVRRPASTSEARFGLVRGDPRKRPRGGAATF